MNQTRRTYNQRTSYTQHCGVDTDNPSSDEQVQWTCEPKTSETPTLMTKLHYPFSGKEKDSETGLSYFGARYYEPEMLNIWLSVDPMADKYPSLSPYNYCAWNPIKLVDPDGRDWYEVVNEESGEKEIKWTDYHNQKEMDDNKQSGTYLGEVFVHFEGQQYEALGDNNKMDGDGAISATVTIYGKNNGKDIRKYNGMTTPCSNDYSTLDEGDYRAYYQDMATSVYGEAGAKKKGIPTALTYRIAQLDGNTTLRGKHHGKPTNMTGIFMHRTDWNGNASNSSHGCLVIDGRDWRNVEKQIGKSNNIYIRVSR